MQKSVDNGDVQTAPKKGQDSGDTYPLSHPAARRKTQMATSSEVPITILHTHPILVRYLAGHSMHFVDPVGQ